MRGLLKLEGYTTLDVFSSIEEHDLIRIVKSSLAKRSYLDVVRLQGSQHHVLGYRLEEAGGCVPPDSRLW